MKKLLGVLAPEPVSPPAAIAAGAEEGLLPSDPVTLAPDPLIGPILRRFTRYILSREVIRVRTGIVFRRTVQVELYRYGTGDADISETEGVLQRYRGTRNIHLFSSDPDTPYIVLRDLHDASALLDRLRRSAAVQQQKRVPLNAGMAGLPIAPRDLP